MDAEGQLGRLLELAEELGIEVRSAGEAASSAAHPGGCLIRLKGREVLLLDASSALADRLDAVCLALRDRPELETRYLPPALRQRLESEGG